MARYLGEIAGGGGFKKDGRGSWRDEVAPGRMVGVLEEMVGFLGEMEGVPREMSWFLEAWVVLREVSIITRFIAFLNR